MPSKIGSICWCWLLKRQLRVQTTPRISCLLNESFVRPLDSCTQLRTEEYGTFFNAKLVLNYFRSSPGRVFQLDSKTTRLGRWSSWNTRWYSMLDKDLYRREMIIDNFWTFARDFSLGKKVPHSLFAIPSVPSPESDWPFFFFGCVNVFLLISYVILVIPRA